MKPGFLEKLLERVGRIEPQEIQNYLLRLAREKGFFETIFNAIREGVIVTDPQGRISYLNQAASLLFGLDQENTAGQLLSEKVKGLDWNSLAHSEKIISRDMEVFYPENRFLNFYVVPLTLEKALKDRKSKTGDAVGQELVGYAVILRDITESKRSTEETIESERLSALTLLAAGVAHEIGNPLNSLDIHLQLLERKLRKLPDELRADLQEPVRIAKEEIQRLDDIINQFLSAIRPAPLKLEPQNVNTLVEESISFLAAEIQDRDILVEQELRSDLPLVEVDRNQIKQAFYNVIKNSFQAMKSEGILHIKTDADENHVLIIFTDTGGGISAEVMSKIFDPYFTTKQSGSGLGLMIVRRIVREHRGGIDIVSNEGQGVSLTIRLPLRNKRARMLGGGNTPAAAADEPEGKAP